MTPATHFCTDPRELTGMGGAYVRGEAELPDGAVWLPIEANRARRPIIVFAGVVAAAVALWSVAPPTNAAGALLGLAVAGLVGVALWKRRRGPRPTQSVGPQGMLLLNDHLVYRIGDDCALVVRADITGIERRKGTGQGVVGACTLAGRTGRGALPLPRPGRAVIQKLDAWLARPSS